VAGRPASRAVSARRGDGRSVPCALSWPVRCTPAARADHLRSAAYEPANACASVGPGQCWLRCRHRAGGAARAAPAAAADRAAPRDELAIGLAAVGSVAAFWGTRYIHYFALTGLAFLAAGIAVLRITIPPLEARASRLRTCWCRHRCFGHSGAVPGRFLAPLGFHSARLRDPRTVPGDSSVHGRAHLAALRHDADRPGDSGR
jgi:hypothetical protein